MLYNTAFRCIVIHHARNQPPQQKKYRNCQQDRQNDTFIKKNFKLTKDAYAAQHKDELDTFNKSVRTLMKLNGSTAVDFSALDFQCRG